MSTTTEQSFPVSSAAGEVSSVLVRPQGARWLYVMGHGAGAGMKHVFMEQMVARLADRQVATFRYQFPYMERGSRRPDPRPWLLETVRAAVLTAGELAGGLRFVAGGKSMGGRMTSQAQAQEPLPGVEALAFVGFPLHPAGRPSVERADHLSEVHIPMLFLQGTRDKLAEPERLRPICSALGSGALLHEVDAADHSFHVLKRSGRNEEEVLDELVGLFVSWLDSLE
jgi:predicted alpha/beta-hydrolase family hydrolase